MRTALLLASLFALLSLAPSPTATMRDDCESTCLDVCQTEGDDLVQACSCDFGCGCLCASFANGNTCSDFPGCARASGLTAAQRACKGRARPPWSAR